MRNTAARGIRRGRWRHAALAFAVALPLAAGGTPARAAPATTAPPRPPAAAAVSPAGAERQATLVDQEDQRIMQTRAVLSSILEVGGREAAKWKQPQIFGSAQGKTLVLPQRSDDAAYTVADLVRFGGPYFRRLGDGSYLLGAHVFVADGAKLLLSSTTRPLTIRMGSVPGAFSSIVGFGADISVTGTAKAPVRIMSWNTRARQPDTQVADGRAYLRAVGGVFRMNHVQVTDMGFWSGRTGGIALTGTDRPGSDTKHLNKAQRHEAKKERLAKKPSTGSGGGGNDDLQLSPAGPPGAGGTASHVPAANLVSGAVENSVIAGDAYGIFVSGSSQTQIVNNTIKNSLVNGVLMHRYAKNANIQNTTVVGSKGDGVVLSRATQKVRITGCTSERNGGNGFTVNGQALADGTSPSGEAVDSFGDSSVNNSTARDNGHYGIELLGGTNLAVQTSKVFGGDMGIVVRAQATNVQISGNQLTGQVRQGIALRDGVTDADVAGNTVTGAATGIYLRNASGKLMGNVVRSATAHGITLRGHTGGSEVRSNTLEGTGTSAVSTSGSRGSVVTENNNVARWHDTSTFLTKALRYAKPMNVIWLCVLLLVIFTILRSRVSGVRRARRGTHPYALQRRMAERPVRTLRPQHGDPRWRDAAAPSRASGAPARSHPVHPGGVQPGFTGTAGS